MSVWQGQDFFQMSRMMSTGQPSVEAKLFPNKTWEVKVVNKKASSHDLFRGIPSHLLERDAMVQFVHVITQNGVCIGNDDFHHLVTSKTGMNGEIPITITSNDVYQQHPFCSIRHSLCSLLIPSRSDRCPACRVHRGDLFSISSRLKRQESTGNTTSITRSTTRNDLLSLADLIKKANQLSYEKNLLKQKIATTKKKIEEMVVREEEVLQPHQDCLLQDFSKANEASMEKVLGEDSPAAFLWQQQKQSMTKGKGMRWHPALIRWCIALQSKSSSAYNLLRESGFICLPHPSTLHPYSHFGNPTTGFNSDMVMRIINDINMAAMPDHEKNITIAFDEMKVKSDLVYNARSGRIVGFLDVGELGNEILAFERRCSGEEEVPVASHVLVLMVRGIFSSLHAPIGYYATCGATSFQLATIVTEAIMLLEARDFSVRGLVSDGASPNRKFYKMFGEQQEDGGMYYAPNPADPSRKIYLFCDVPHLMKTTRNNWEHSRWNRKTRNLHLKKQDIKWTQLVELYNTDVGMDRFSPGLRRLHKIIHDHLHLTPSLRMRVYMAAQVLSTTVHNAFKAQNRHDTKSTELFVSIFNQFFDCLNVSNSHDGKHKRKPALLPYTETDDWRFKWLLEVFLDFLDEWEAEADSHPHLDKAARQKMCLSKETLAGIRITVHSFVELGRSLLSEPGVNYLLSEKFSQDHLEEYFSKQRSSGGSWDNPTVEQ